jgi:chromatin remodeling complex protein RSC6
MSSTKAAKKTTTKKAPASAAPAKEKKKSKKEETKEVEAAAQTSTPTEKKERKRRQVDKESVDKAFEEVQTRISAEIDKLREADGKVRGIKFLRSINKAIKTLHSDTKRVMKLKKKNNRKKTVVSGFLKPIKITPELAAFTGWDINQTYSRVNVTKHICDYIKGNHLYDEEDKRNILCDDKLKNLLRYDPNNVPMAKDGKPALLNYFRLQRYLKPHFIKIETDKSDAGSKAESEPKPKKEKAAKPAKPATAPTSKAKPASKKAVEIEDEDLEDEDAE